jgi:sucrose-phosphate synthase
MTIRKDDKSSFCQFQSCNSHMKKTNKQLYIAIISVHGLIRESNLELGRDADTGGQTLYVLEMAKALSQHPDVGRVDLITQSVNDKTVDKSYAQPVEVLSKHLQIVRIDTGLDAYTYKEQLWDNLDNFSDNLMSYFRQQPNMPDLLHSHYADAGYVGTLLSNSLGIPLVHTGHSLGRVKRQRLLAVGLKPEEIETRYNMSRRIDAEEGVLATAQRVITSTHQEIEEQYELYDYYQPEQMRVVPPGTDLNKFKTPLGGELSSPYFKAVTQHLAEPNKPIILALSRPDKRKNIVTLVEAYGQSKELQELANLVIVAGNRDDVDELEAPAREVFVELLVAMDRYELYNKMAMPKHHQRDDVPMFYRMAAASGGVFVNPALTEPFGLTLIEAAASGVPIVATEDGGPRDIVANCQNGILADPLEPKSFTDAILNLLSDKARWQACAESGVNGVNEHYAWTAHVDKYMEIIKPVIERAEPLLSPPFSRRESLYADRAIVMNLDETLTEDESAVANLVSVLKAHRKSTKFAIATGRSLDASLRILRKLAIPEPDMLITSSGSEIHYAPKLTTDVAWKRHIDYQWSPQNIRALLDDMPGLEKQPKSEQTDFKLSYFIDTDVIDLEEIKSLLYQHEQTVNVQLAYDRYLDILPSRASKGQALRYVAERWQIPYEKIFVAGSSWADEDMVRGNFLSAVIQHRPDEGLAQLEEVEGIYFTENKHVGGILEALEYYDFFGRCVAPEKEVPHG